MSLVSCLLYSKEVDYCHHHHLMHSLLDCVSRLATILFAHRFGPALEAETKRYRLAADVFNDSAMILDCLSPAFPRSARILMLCCSGSLRAACGVAGGGSKASLSVHFARSGNVGELNAKVGVSTPRFASRNWGGGCG